MHALPEALLAKILQRLPLREQMDAAAMVSSEWAQAAALSQSKLWA